jgi:hypothetical protein
MKQSRLVRQLYLLKLYRRAAAYTLRDARDIFRCGKLGAGMKMIRQYQRFKSFLAETQATVSRLLAGIIAA